MTARCELYGLVIESDAPLPGISLVGRSDAPDVRVHFAARPPGAEQWGAASVREFHRSEQLVGQAPTLIADRPGDGRVIRLRYAEGIRFHVDDGGTEVWSDWDPPLTEADAVTFLLGPVLGLVLRRRGVLAVHASAVVSGRRAWAFVGPGGAGKSTLAAAMARAGFPVLSEDVLALTPASPGWLAWPAYDHLRLWDDTPALPGGSASELPALSPTWDKRALSLGGAGLPRANRAVPLAGWFLLEERLGPEGLPGGLTPVSAVPQPGPAIAPLPGGAALRGLIENSYVNYLLDAPARAAELVALGRAAQGLRAYRLRVGEGERGLASSVEEVSRVIRGDTAAR